MQRPQPDPQRLPPRAPSQPAARGFGDGAALSPTQRIGAPSSQVTAAARERAVQHMAYEEAWKACNPDFKTPFASVEDAVSRIMVFDPKEGNEFCCSCASTCKVKPWLLPYHVFADYEEDDVGDAQASGAKSSAQVWHDAAEDRTLNMVSEFEKQVLTFNLLARGRGEEQYILERNLFQQECVQSEHARAVIVQQEKQRHEEAARTRLALAHAEAQAKAQAQAQAAQAQAQVAGVWQMAQAQGHANPWQQAIVAVMACGEGFPGVAGQTVAPGMSMLPEHDPATARALLMMQQQQQPLLPQQLGMGVWPTFVAPLGEASSSVQAGAPAVLQDQAVGQTTTSGVAAVRTMPQWWQNAAPKEQ